MIREIIHVNINVSDSDRSLAFYEALGFELIYGGTDAEFSSLRAGSGIVNLTTERPDDGWSWWGRVIFHVADVDETYAQALAAGFPADTTPRDAQWGERYFHITDPDGHELSFARLLGDS